MLDKLINWASSIVSGLEKETQVLRELNQDVQAAVRRMEEKDPGLRQLLKDAYGYAVFPSVGRASVVVGGAYGKGELFQRGKLAGYAALVQLTIGVQLGGQTFSEIVAFENKQAFDRFKQGKLAFAASASAVLIKAGAASASNYEKGAAVFVDAEGGLMLELAIGGQKFIVKPAVLGKVKRAQPTKSTSSKRAQSTKSRTTPRRSARSTPKRSARAARRKASRAPRKARV